MLVLAGPGEKRFVKKLAWPQPEEYPHRRMESARHWLPRGMGVLAFACYALAATPGYTWVDSGELSAAGIGLGVPHPTGFPLYILLVKLASFIPVGELAFRANILSAACGGVAVGGVCRLLLILGDEEDGATLAGAFAGAGSLAVGLLFAQQATVAAAYVPTAAVFVVTVLLVERVARGGTAVSGLALAWIVGLGLGLHLSYCMAVIPILALMGHRFYRGARWPLLAPILTTLGAVALMLYLPIRSATGRIASLDWGHPNTLQSALAHINARELRLAFDDEIMSTTSSVVRYNAGEFLAQVDTSLGVMAILAGVVGFVMLLVPRRTRWVGATIVSVAVLDGVYAIWLNPMGLPDWQHGVLLSVAIGVGAGVAVTMAARSCGLAAPFVGAVASVVLLWPPVLSTIPALAEQGEMPRDFSEQALLRVDSNSVILSQSESVAAGILYLQSVEGMRPDVASLQVHMLDDDQRVHSLLDSSQLGGVFVPKLNAMQSILFSTRPLYWESGFHAPPSTWSLRVGPILSQLVQSPIPATGIEQTAAELSRLFARGSRRDRRGNRVLANALTNLGRLAYERGNITLAEELFAAAIAVAPRGTAVGRALQELNGGF